MLVLIWAVELWVEEQSSCPILGDNTAALEEALTLKGKAAHQPLAQALAVIRGRQNIELIVAHLPSEENTAADALSRLAAPGDDHKPFPFAHVPHPPRELN